VSSVIAATPATANLTQQMVHRETCDIDMANDTIDEATASSMASQRDDSHLVAETVPLDAVSAAATQKKPPPESPDAIRLRVFVIASFWAIVIFLGLPIWWGTTMVYRASLPLQQMNDWADGKVSMKRLLLWGNSNKQTDMSTRLPFANIYRSCSLIRSGGSAFIENHATCAR
jgi:hypothetical protein